MLAMGRLRAACLFAFYPCMEPNRANKKAALTVNYTPFTNWFVDTYIDVVKTVLPSVHLKAWQDMPALS